VLRPEQLADATSGQIEHGVELRPRKGRMLPGSLQFDEFGRLEHHDVRIYPSIFVFGVCEVELAGMRHVLGADRTAVVIDARPAASFAKGSLPQARNIPGDLVLPGKDTGEVKKAKDDGRLPMEDHNTRILVLGRDAAEARYVAEALTREAFDNVGYFAGAFEEARRGLRGE